MQGRKRIVRSLDATAPLWVMEGVVGHSRVGWSRGTLTKGLAWLVKKLVKLGAETNKIIRFFDGICINAGCLKRIISGISMKMNFKKNFGVKRRLDNKAIPNQIR